MRLIITILIFLPYGVSFGQTILGHDYKDDPYEFSQKIMDDLKRDTLPDKYSIAAMELSFINNYKQALALCNIERKPYKKLEKADSLYFLRFKPTDARAYILEQARKSQIVIINEAHEQPLHRIFPESFLRDLYKIGYRYLGMETLNTGADTTLNKRKYPVINTGCYSRQPQYGNLIRTALQDGFYVFGYEADFSKNFNMSPKEREIEQAKNIRALLDTNPCARILIHCGYDHLIETEIKGWEKAMAGRLKEYTGIDPFTISETWLTEMGDTAYESHIFRMLNLNYDVVFTDSRAIPLTVLEVKTSLMWLYITPAQNGYMGAPISISKTIASLYLLTIKLQFPFPVLSLPIMPMRIPKSLCPPMLLNCKIKRTGLHLP